ncbi:MAG TPA: YoaK family protein [Pseudorhodoferax sp.]|jgi:uncharacterized membrane protein YoaK (UPF0700 family)|nr:YoaK family protein [Pseudorhodoferax sp.]
MRRFLVLTSRHRAPSTNQALGLLLAFNAGAINAGGFLVLHQYTSHMTGFSSQLADGLALGQVRLVLTALGALLAFIAGAAATALLVNWGRQRRLDSIYALPLLCEALLMFPFGLMGAITLGWQTPFTVPLTVLLLSFIMGLQNAVSSKASGGRVRTTHMTGNVTDLGMELGKMLYLNRARLAAAARGPVRHDRSKLRLTGGLLAAFVLGGMAGALGFTHLGFVCVVPLAALLMTVSLPPLWRDLHKLRPLLMRPR